MLFVAKYDTVRARYLVSYVLHLTGVYEHISYFEVRILEDQAAGIILPTTHSLRPTASAMRALDYLVLVKPIRQITRSSSASRVIPFSQPLES